MNMSSAIDGALESGVPPIQPVSVNPPLIVLGLVALDLPFFSFLASKYFLTSSAVLNSHGSKNQSS